MSIIIRLQNLPWEANSVDIRKFFSGLSIPDGGVHIVGGEKGDAFIAFQTDEDARQAFSRDGGVIRDTQVKLFLSSRTEMKSVIDQARSAVNAAKLSQQKAPAAVTSASTTSSVASLPATSVHNFTSQNVPSTSFNQQQPNQQSGGFQSQYASHASQDPRIAVRERSRSPINRSSMGLGSVEPSGNRPNVGGTPMGGLVPISSGSGYGGAISTQTGLIPDASAGGPGWSRRGVGDFSSAGNQGNGFVPQPQGLSLNGVRPQLQQGFQAPAAPSFRLLELRGLPFTVTPREIQDFFRVGVGMFIPDDHIRILVDDRGLLTGGATVRVTNDADFNTALTMNGKLLGGRRIDVMPLVDPTVPSGQHQAPLNGGGIGLPQPIGNQIQPNLTQPIQPPPQQQQQQPPPQNLPRRDYIVYMKGIPFNACTDRDVANFFSGLRITEIIFETDRRTGKPAGNAFVEFPSREDYEGALELNLRHMGRRYIEVFPTNREDMEDARCVANAVLAEKATFCIHITGLPPTITNADLTSYFKDAGAVPFAIHIMLKADGLNAGAAFLEFSSREHQQLAFRRDGDVINGCRISVKEFAFDEMRKIVGRPLNPPVPPGGAGGGRNGFSGGGDRFGDRGRGRGGFRGGRGGGFGGRGDRGSPPRRDPFADGHCVIHASNVPYKATNDDLRAFFQDFAVLPNGIERRLNEKGLATPEARIAFKNMLEAERAVKAMHKKHLLGRPVFLRLAV